MRALPLSSLHLPARPGGAARAQSAMLLPPSRLSTHPHSECAAISPGTTGWGYASHVPICSGARHLESLPSPARRSPVIYARDAVAGGKWMGLNSANGAFAALTDVRTSAPRPVGGPSRGSLVLNALKRPGKVAATAG